MMSKRLADSYIDLSDANDSKASNPSVFLKASKGRALKSSRAILKSGGSGSISPMIKIDNRSPNWRNGKTPLTKKSK
jgi:hypothetical protein